MNKLKYPPYVGILWSRDAADTRAIFAALSIQKKARSPGNEVAIRDNTGSISYMLSDIKTNKLLSVRNI